MNPLPDVVNPVRTVDGRPQYQCLDCNLWFSADDTDVCIQTHQRLDSRTYNYERVCRKCYDIWNND